MMHQLLLAGLLSQEFPNLVLLIIFPIKQGEKQHKIAKNRTIGKLVMGGNKTKIHNLSFIMP